MHVFGHNLVTHQVDRFQHIFLFGDQHLPVAGFRMFRVHPNQHLFRGFVIGDYEQLIIQVVDHCIVVLKSRDEGFEPGVLQGKILVIERIATG